ncbi:MAG TPA: hypothetical protein VKA95_00415 [Nitrososphaeraceae archaeon]|nr:hypothetical protein [Nitrososphaeraceae archaeon]
MSGRIFRITKKARVVKGKQRNFTLKDTTILRDDIAKEITFAVIIISLSNIAFAIMIIFWLFL